MDGFGEQLLIGILEDIAHARGKFGHLIFARIPIPDQYGPGSRLQQPIQMLDEGRFPGPILPDDSDLFASFDGQRDAVQGLNAGG